MVDRRLHGTVGGVDHQPDDGVGLDDADSGDLVADDVGNPAGERFGRFGQPHGDDVLEARLGQRLQKQ